MANFLALCNKVHRLAGMAGTGFTDVTNTDPVSQRVAHWVRDADVDVQGLNPHWQFLWVPFSVATTTREVSYSGTADVVTFDYDAFKAYATADGVVTQYRMTYVDYETFRFRFELGDTTRTGSPTYVTIRHDGTMLVHPTPDEEYTIYCEGYLKPTEMAANTDTSPVPERYEDIIVYGALKQYSLFENATLEYQAWDMKYKEILSSLERDYVPVAVAPIIPFA